MARQLANHAPVIRTVFTLADLFASDCTPLYKRLLAGAMLLLACTLLYRATEQPLPRTLISIRDSVFMHIANRASGARPCGFAVQADEGGVGQEALKSNAFMLTSPRWRGRCRPISNSDRLFSSTSRSARTRCGISER